MWISNVVYKLVTNDLKDGTILVLNNGHKFKKEAKYKKETNWICINNQSSSRCNARLTINDENKTKFGSRRHNHCPNK